MKKAALKAPNTFKNLSNLMSANEEDMFEETDNLNDLAIYEDKANPDAYKAYNEADLEMGSKLQFIMSHQQIRKWNDERKYDPPVYQTKIVMFTKKEVTEMYMREEPKTVTHGATNAFTEM